MEAHRMGDAPELVLEPISTERERPIVDVGTGHPRSRQTAGFEDRIVREMELVIADIPATSGRQINSQYCADQQQRRWRLADVRTRRLSGRRHLNHNRTLLANDAPSHSAFSFAQATCG